MAYSGTGTKLDPYVVDNMTDFITCVNLASDIFVKLAADLDFTSQGQITINEKVVIDGDGHKFSNIFIADYNHQFTCSGRFVAFKNLSIDILYVNKASYRSWGNETPVFCTLSAGNSGIILDNCDIKVRSYLATPTSDNTVIYGYMFAIAAIIKCNIIMDNYYITPRGNVNCIGASNLYTNRWSEYNLEDYGYIEDSIIKITLYDPNGWSKASAFSESNNTDCWGIIDCNGRISNSGLFLRHKIDFSMHTKTKIAFVRSAKVLNSYFVYENLGNLSLTPVIYGCYFMSYAFYDKTKAPNIIFDNCTYIYSSNQVKGLTTEQCKDRVTFEGDYTVDPPIEPIIPFRLKQSVEP